MNNLKYIYLDDNLLHLVVHCKFDMGHIIGKYDSQDDHILVFHIHKYKKLVIIFYYTHNNVH